jgi:hypothetical protein
MRLKPSNVARLPGVLLVAAALGMAAVPGRTQQIAPSSSHARSWPPYLSRAARPGLPSDYIVQAQNHLPIPIVMRDTVVSNVDPQLTNTDTFGDSEPSIALDPSNPRRILILAFSSNFDWPQNNQPVWVSQNGGATWQKSLTMTAPPPGNQGTFDQTPDFSRSGFLFVTNLSFPDIFTGGTFNPTSAAAWNWFLVGGDAQPTNLENAQPPDVDQPWLLVNRDPVDPLQDNTYVAYDDFAPATVASRVSVARGTTPADFVWDGFAGPSVDSEGDTNPGLRLATDPRTGAIYALWQQSDARTTRVKDITYVLNRSTDGGYTWNLNGSEQGITIAHHESFQGFNAKFGTVNALLGGVDHAAVDPHTGDVYCVVGERDAGGNNRLAVMRQQPDPAGGLDLGPEVLLTPQAAVQAALPSVAVTRNGTVGVLFDTFDGFTGDGFPVFTAHLSVSEDQGATFDDFSLLTFSSVEKDNGNARQRVLGDFQQLKAMGNTFFGVFTANGVPFGRPFANTDAIFFSAQVAAPGRVLPLARSLDFGTVRGNGVGLWSLALANPTDRQVTVTSLHVDNPMFLIRTAVPPFDIAPRSRAFVNLVFRPITPGNPPPPPGRKTGTLTIASTDPAGPARVALTGRFAR